MQVGAQIELVGSANETLLGGIVGTIAHLDEIDAINHRLVQLDVEFEDGRHVLVWVPPDKVLVLSDKGFVEEMLDDDIDMFEVLRDKGFFEEMLDDDIEMFELFAQRLF